MTDELKTPDDSNELVSAALPTDIQDALNALGCGDYRVGDWVIDEHGHLKQITKISFRNDQYTSFKDVLHIECRSNGGYANYTEHLDVEYLGRKANGRRYYYRLEKSPEATFAEAISEMQNPTPAQPASTSSAITASASADRMKTIMAQREKVADHAMVLKLVVERKIVAMRQKYDKIMREVVYMGRVIALLETFIGVYEKIILIREGEPAGASTPVTLRQAILYIDEEVGSIDYQRDGQRGIDFGNVEKFDEWLLSDPRYIQRIAPEQKCVVAMRPSRQDRNYSDNWFENSAQRKQNDFIYLLIRNGEQVSRVWANMTMGNYDRLFPTNEEMEALTEKLTTAEIDGDDDKQLSVKTEQLDWQHNAVLIEGLFERTDLFKPVPGRLSLFDRGCYERNEIILVRDAEQHALDSTTGRPSYKQWHKQLNAELTRGSRILNAGLEYSESRYGSQYFLNNKSAYEPPYPKKGLYTLDSVERRHEEDVDVVDGYEDGRNWMSIPAEKRTYHKEHRFDEYLTFLYMPTGIDGEPLTVWVRDPVYYGVMPKERTQRIRCFVRRDDWFILNYDRISLEDVQYYISNRAERKDYLQVLPTLYGIRAERLKERQYEQPFVTLIANDLNCEESAVWTAVDWWKYKTIGHRGLGEDEAKAWRMIRKRVLNPTYLDNKTDQTQE